MECPLPTHTQTHKHTDTYAKVSIRERLVREGERKGKEGSEGMGKVNGRRGREGEGMGREGGRKEGNQVRFSLFATTFCLPQSHM